MKTKQRSISARAASRSIIGCLLKRYGGDGHAAAYGGGCGSRKTAFTTRSSAF